MPVTQSFPKIQGEGHSCQTKISVFSFVQDGTTVQVHNSLEDILILTNDVLLFILALIS